jgi:hypothetical protein
VKLDGALREYCHVLRFPSGWQIPSFIQAVDGRQHLLHKFGLADGYEFRVSGLLGTKFLVRGVEEIVHLYYTTNIYEADLSDPKGIAQPATEDKWNTATVIDLHRGTYNEGARVWELLRKNGKIDQIKQSGSNPDPYNVMAVSPDQALLVLYSWSGKLGSGGNNSNPGDFSISLPFGLAHGKLFFDVYNTDTAKKLITITASFVGILPEAAFGPSAWITERYFLIPLDERRERCLICEFGQKR